MAGQPDLRSFLNLQFVSILILLLSPVIAVPFRDTNVTVTVPVGTTIQAKHLLCTPVKWSDIASFYLGNYIAHAATVKSLAGEPAIPYLLNMLFALCFPMAGASRGLLAILYCAISGKTPLEKANRARALCMVVRSKIWRPKDGDIIQEVRSPSPDFLRSASLLSHASRSQVSN
jgi:hypothetical protein